MVLEGRGEPRVWARLSDPGMMEREEADNLPSGGTEVVYRAVAGGPHGNSKGPSTGGPLCGCLEGCDRTKGVVEQTRPETNIALRELPAGLAPPRLGMEMGS